MKTVEAPYAFLTPPAAPIEDMTQPMGPLEEGDQALVDAAHRLPAGEHVAKEQGVHTRVVKVEDLARDQVVVETTNPDGAHEGVSTLITRYEQPDVAISADMSEWLAGGNGGKTTAYVHGNKVDGVSGLTTDRAKAQAIKLEVAGKIDAATQRLSEHQVQDPELAHEMALAEQPHRDEVAERNKDVVLAKEMADLAVQDYVNNTGNVQPTNLTETQLQHTMLRGATENANKKSLERANTASEEVRDQHQAES